MNSATGQSPSKRARIDTSANVDPGTAPMESGTSHLQRYCSESLPVTIAPLYCQMAKTYLVQMVRIFHKKNQIAKFQDDQDYIPRSIKIIFSLNALDETIALPEFIELKTTTNNLIKKFQKDVKATILKSI